MEWAGARGALTGGGLVIAGSIAAGYLLRERRTPVPVTVRTEERGGAAQPELCTAA